METFRNDRDGPQGRIAITGTGLGFERARCSAWPVARHLLDRCQEKDRTLGRRDDISCTVCPAMGRVSRSRWGCGSRGILVAWFATVSACATIPPGHVGVLLKPNGVAPLPLGEGAHLVNPLSRVELYDLRVDEHNEDLAAISADGVTLEARASILTFHAAPGEVVALAREVGPRFYDMVVLPVVSSTVRMVLAGMRADRLDTPSIIRAQAEVTLLAGQRLRPFHIIVDSVNLRTLGISFASAAYAEVIDTGVEEQKLLMARQQVALARRQADNLREQARGIAAAHTIVKPTLTPGILQDGTDRAWSALLTSPLTTVEVRASEDSTLTEIEP